MHCYSAVDPRLGRVEYRDRKRWLWALSVVYPLVPFSGIGLHALTGQPAWLLLPLVIGYVGGPILDAWLGEDRNNPPEAVVPQLEADRYYRWLTYAVVPLHFLALIGCAVWAGSQDLPVWAFLALAYVAGTTSGLGINTGHELGHKHTALEVWLAKLVLAVPAYGHFRIEHNRGHQPQRRDGRQDEGRFEGVQRPAGVQRQHRRAAGQHEAQARGADELGQQPAGAVVGVLPVGVEARRADLLAQRGFAVQRITRRRHRASPSWPGPPHGRTPLR